MVSFFKDLNKICSNLDEIYDVNSGGCCYVAYLIAKLLTQYGYSNYNLEVYSDEGYFNKFQDITTSQNHYVITYNNIDINQGSFEKDLYYISTFKHINAHDILLHYLDKSWNSIYESNDNKYIANTLSNFFKEHFDRKHLETQ